MILIIDVCAERLHSYEFVRPIKAIVGVEGVVKHYKELCESDINKAQKVIICGTGLADDGYLEDIKEFSWLRDFQKPVLGICAGMQIIGLVFGGKKMRGTEIGYTSEYIDILGVNGVQEVYKMHNNYVDFFGTGFLICSDGAIPQAVSRGRIYGVLFHPEVRQCEIISNFLAL